MSRKVVLVLVEGEAEETVLTEYLEEVFGTDEVFLDVQHGDVLSDWNKVKNAKLTITDIIKSYLRKSKFHVSDLKGVFQITDSDGVFIQNENIIVDEDLKDKIIYDVSSIQVCNENKKMQVEKRNEQKSRNIKILFSTDYIHIDRTKVPYKIYYFSTNLDHVLWGERNEARGKKTKKAEHFIETLEVSLEDFLWEFSTIGKNDVTERSYVESWQRIIQDTNSLKRATNITLLFDLARRNSSVELN